MEFVITYHVASNAHIMDNNPTRTTSTDRMVILRGSVLIIPQDKPLGSPVHDVLDGPVRQSLDIDMPCAVYAGRPKKISADFTLWIIRRRTRC